MALPLFKYHPEPLVTGSIAKSGKQCRCCGRKTGFIYTGPVYAAEELEQALCPWCIADGSAAKLFDAVFVDPAGIGDGQVAVAERVVEEVSSRTPGFCGWQQERWLGCCDDAAAFLGPVGAAELRNLPPEAAEAVRQECGLQGAEWERYLHSLSRDNGPTAYLFRCIRCNRLLAYSDAA
jgi:uncharacterized protein CbrC (UPF0167 family)